jgi:hypothetical protein
MKILNLSRETFAPYGRILTEDWNVKNMISVMDHFSVKDGVTYFPSISELENTKEGKENSEKFGGGLPIEIGYCIGFNNKLDAFEYHRSSEINIAATDLVVILGLQKDVDEEYHYDTSKAVAFMIPKGSVIEFYATTLHYAPCSVNGNEFKSIVMLPKGTNESIVIKQEIIGELKLIMAKNKWLIAHEEAKIEGAFIGLDGVNLSL